MASRESPRIRRLRTDLRALETLRSESTVVDFTVPSNLYGGLPESYVIRFYGKGLWKPENSEDVLLRERHEMTVTLGASYPRMQPELQWKTPIFHPNISAGGVVCLGGYQTHWVPSVNLDELCTMLWDMIRYANYDVESPYNREAAQWARTQSQFQLPLDDRPIRDRVATGRHVETPPSQFAANLTPPEPDVVFLDSPSEPEDTIVQPGPGQFVEIVPGLDQTDAYEVIDAEIVEAEIVEEAEQPDTERPYGLSPFQASSTAGENPFSTPDTDSDYSNSGVNNADSNGGESSESGSSDSSGGDVVVPSATASDSDDPDIMFIE